MSATNLILDVETIENQPTKHRWTYDETFLVYVMYRLHIFRGYRNSYLDFICDRVDIDYKSINMAYKNIDHLYGIKGLDKYSATMKTIFDEQRNTSLRSLVMLVRDEDIRERLLNLVR
jgi:hypothetical protein